MLIEGDTLAFYKTISNLTEYSEIQQKMKPQSSWHIWTMTLANNYRFHFGGHFRKIAEDRERGRGRGRGRERGKEREGERERLKQRRPQSELLSVVQETRARTTFKFWLIDCQEANDSWIVMLSLNKNNKNKKTSLRDFCFQEAFFF